MNFNLRLPLWTILSPVIAWLVYLIKNVSSGLGITVLLSVSLIAAVLAAVHHAEVVAHKVGEPFGTLILAIAVTVLELSLILTLMSAGGEETMTLARDTIFAANMIILNGIMGLCLMIGGAKFHEQFIIKHSATTALITLTAILVLTLVLPNYTHTSIGPKYNNAQMIFVSIACLALYLGFVFIQSLRHRDYFLPSDGGEDEDHANPPSAKTTFASLVLLIAGLGAVILIAKALSPTIEAGVKSIGAPQSMVGIIIAMVILLPEGLAAINAARKNRLQTSLNLSLGSALASTGLTISAVAVYSVASGTPILLGIDTKSVTLLLLSVFTIMLSLVTGKTNVLYGFVLIVLFATYLFITMVP